MAAKVKGLQMWCQRQAEGYRDVNVTNMTSSWKSGLAFCAIIHRYRPDLIDYDSLSKENVYENNKLGFDTALSLGIPALLDAEDMVAMRVPDKLCIVTYVSQYYNYFRDKKPLGGPGVKGKKTAQKRTSDAVPSMEPETKKPVEEAPRDSTVDGGRPAQISRAGSYGDLCSLCGKKVYLMERHMEGKKLYHRRCFRGSQRSHIIGGRSPLSSVSSQDNEGSPKTSRAAGALSSSYLTSLQNQPATKKSITQMVGERKAVVGNKKVDYGKHQDTDDKQDFKESNTHSPVLSGAKPKLRHVEKMDIDSDKPTGATGSKDAARAGLMQNLTRIRNRYPLPSNGVGGAHNGTSVVAQSDRPIRPSVLPDSARYNNRDQFPSASGGAAKFSPSFSPSASKTRDMTDNVNGRSFGFHTGSPSKRSPVPARARSPSSQCSDSESSSSSRPSPPPPASWNRPNYASSAQHSPPPKPYTPPASPGAVPIMEFPTRPVPSRLSPPPFPQSPPPSPGRASDDSSSTNSNRHSPPPSSPSWRGQNRSPPVPQPPSTSPPPGPVANPADMQEELTLDISSSDSSTPRSILKSDAPHDSPSGTPRSILKSKESEVPIQTVTLVVEKDPSPRSILKGQQPPTERRHSEGSSMVNFKSILKSSESTSAEQLENMHSPERSTSPPRSILKSKEDLRSESPEAPRSILKKSLDDLRHEDLVQGQDSEQPKSILKKSTEDLQESTSPPKPGRPTGILKRLPDERSVSPKPAAAAVSEEGPRSILKFSEGRSITPPRRSSEGSPLISADFSGNHMSAFNLEDSIELTSRAMTSKDQATTSSGSNMNSSWEVEIDARMRLSPRSPGSPAVGRLASPEPGVRKPEWQLEAERRSALRGGKYLDPERGRQRNTTQWTDSSQQPVSALKTDKPGTKTPAKSKQTNIVIISEDRVTRDTEKVTIDAKDTNIRINRKSEADLKPMPSPAKQQLAPKFGQVEQASAKPEWQREAERRQQVRNGQYKDPEHHPYPGRSPTPMRRRSADDLLDGKEIIQTFAPQKPARSPKAKKVSPSSPMAHSTPRKPARPADPPHVNGKTPANKQNIPRKSPPPNRPPAPLIRLGTPKRPAPPVPRNPGSPPPPRYTCGDVRRKIRPGHCFRFESASSDSSLSSHEDTPELPPRGYRGKDVALAAPGQEPIRRKVYSELPIAVTVILEQLQSLDGELQDLEAQGCVLEDKIRNETDDEMDDGDLMVQWFDLINKKNDLVRKEADLMYRQRQQDLEAQQEDLEYELRCLMAKEDKTEWEQERETALLEEVMHLVAQRGSIVDCIEEDRIRYLEEDQEIADMMVAKGFVVREEPSFEEVRLQPSPPPQKKEKKKGKKWHKKFSM